MKCLLISFGLALLNMNLVRGYSLLPDSNKTSEQFASNDKHVTDDALQLSDFIRGEYLLNPIEIKKNESIEENAMPKQATQLSTLLDPILQIITRISEMNALIILINAVRDTVTTLMSNTGLTNQLISRLLISILPTTAAESAQTPASSGPTPNLEFLAVLNNYVSQIMNALSSTNGSPASGSTNSPISTALLTNVLSQLLAGSGTVPERASTSVTASGSVSGSGAMSEN